MWLTIRTIKQSLLALSIPTYVVGTHPVAIEINSFLQFTAKLMMISVVLILTETASENSQMTKT